VMNSDERAVYDKSRNLSTKALPAICYAAHTNLYFDMQGSVKACCWNSEHPLGNVQTHTLDEMWSGAQAQILRRALENYNLAFGCTFCKNQISDGWTTGAVSGLPASSRIRKILGRRAVPNNGVLPHLANDGGKRANGKMPHHDEWDTVQSTGRVLYEYLGLQLRRIT
jgi:radical SAM protein with 4Fe4S-binding SPASM domain